MNYYNDLQLPFDATADEIREAYFEAARKYHPDVNPDKEANRIFLKTQNAYETLSSPHKRKIYDQSLGRIDPLSDDVSVKVHYSRRSVLRLPEQQLFYALVELECKQHFDANSMPPVHICLVLDRSTSMSGERLEMVRANVSQLLRKMRPFDLISIVTFSDRAEVVTQTTDLHNPHAVEAQLYSIQVGGATEIYQGLEAGYRLLMQNKFGADFKFLILITDGHTYGDEAACLDLAAKAWSDGLSITCMGIGHEWNDEFLDRLAASGGGSCGYVNDAGELSKLFERKLESIKIRFAHKVELNFEPQENVEIRYVFRIQPDVAPLNLERPMPIGALEYGNKTVFIIEFKIAPTISLNERICLLKGKITLEIPSRSVLIGRFPIEWELKIGDDSLKEKPPTSILQAMSKLTLYRLQERARSEVQGGNYNQATRHLQHLATHLLSQGNRELARTVLMEADHIQRAHQFSKEGDKRIKYGTRALLMLPIPERQVK
jgi:Ca-activated chloride channel family protein